MTLRIVLWLALMAGVAPLAAHAQSPAAAPAAIAAADNTATVATYRYEGAERRDPFLSLTANLVETTAPVARPDGIAGLAVTELSVRGVMKSRGRLIAMVQGPDNRAYVVHEGDKFADGTVTAVVEDGLVIVQQVNDPLSFVKQREVRKTLRSVEDGKQ